MKRLLEKANSSGRSHQEALTSLRAQPLGDGLTSPSEILHGRSLVTRKASPVDLTVEFKLTLINLVITSLLSLYRITFPNNVKYYA